MSRESGLVIASAKAISLKQRTYGEQGRYLRNVGSFKFQSLAYQTVPG